MENTAGECAGRTMVKKARLGSRARGVRAYRHGLRRAREKGYRGYDARDGVLTKFDQDGDRYDGTKKDDPAKDGMPGHTELASHYSKVKARDGGPDGPGHRETGRGQLTICDQKSVGSPTFACGMMAIE